MAMSTSKVTGSPGTAALALRGLSDGRSSSSSRTTPLDAISQTGFNGVGDERFRQFDDPGFDFNQERGGRKQATPFVVRAAQGFEVGTFDNDDDQIDTGHVFLNEVLNGISIYENNSRIVSSVVAKPGSIFSFRL